MSYQFCLVWFLSILFKLYIVQLKRIMSGPTLASPQLQALQDSHKDLCEAFQSPGVDITVLLEELEEYQIIGKRVALALHSLNPENTGTGLEVRYLVKAIFKAVKANSDLFDNFLSAMINMKMTSVHQLVTKKYFSLKDGPDDDKELFESDLPVLFKMLGAKCGSKWEEIGILLELPKSLLETINRDNDKVTMKLYHVLRERIIGKYGPVKLSQLEKVLKDDTVAHTVIAVSLRESFKEANISNFPTKEKLESCDRFRIISQSRDVEEHDGKSAILEVQTTSNETASFMWMKDDRIINDNDNYLGIDDNMLLIYRACEAIKGNYTCRINGNMISKGINMSVKYGTQEKEELISKYSHLAKVYDDSWPFPTTSNFIMLGFKITHSDHCLAAIKSKAVPQEASEKDIFEELFGLYQPSSLILIEGCPGSGKSTLACKITRDWATQSSAIRYADYVFFLRLRGYQKYEKLVESFESIVKLARETNGKGFCFVFDGLDEWQKKDDTDKVIQSMIQKDDFALAMIIATSRPAAAQKYRRKATKRVEIVGFGTKEVFEYIDRYPFHQLSTSEECKDVSSKLKEYLKMHKNILHMCHLPVHATVICFLFTMEVQIMPETESMVYEHFTRSLILRKLQQKDSSIQLQSLGDLDEDNRLHFEAVCKLAFNMIRESKQVVKSRQDFPIDSLAPSNSLLTIDSMAQMYGVDNVYTFLHLTLQEYLAARHIASLLMNDQYEVIEQYGSCEHMQNTWKFFCGINSHHEEKPTLFMKLMTRIQSDNMYKMECAYESQNTMVCTMLCSLLSTVQHGEFNISSVCLKPINLTVIGFVLTKSSFCPPKLTIHLFFPFIFDKHSAKIPPNASKLSISNVQEYAFSSRTPDFITQSLRNVFSENECLIISDSSFDIQGWLSLSSKYKDVLNLLFLNRCQNYNRKMTQLWKSSNTCEFGKCVNLANSVRESLVRGFKNLSNILASEYSKPLYDALHHCAPGLSVLNIGGSMIGPKGIEMLSVVLKRCSSLSILDVTTNLIGESVSILADGLRHCKALKELKIGTNIINKEGEEILAAATIDLPNLSVVDISFNSIDKIAFANHTNLSMLSICGTVTGSAFTRNNLQFPPLLEILSLSYNNIASNEALAVAQLLKSCTKLQGLDLSCNNIQFEAALEIVESIKDSIEIIYFSCNIIDEEEQVKLHSMYPKITMKFCEICGQDPQEEVVSPNHIQQLQELLRATNSYVNRS